ncbi:MAG: ArsA-related P-loop ATPase [Pyrodictiaceae archaeon]
MPTRIVSFWGKGGTGKTTIAAATSLGLAKEGYSILAVSSDPIPTLCKVIRGRECLNETLVLNGVSIVELSEEKVIELWKKRFGDEVYEVLSSLLPVGREIIDYIAGAPGIADQFLMYYIYEKQRRGDYDYIVWDTPAAGGSIRLLRIEYELYRHMGEAAKLYLRVREVFERIKRREGKSPLKLIEDWRKLAANILSMLASKEHSPHIIATPDELSLSVTRQLEREFRLHGIEAKKIILNMVLEEHVCIEGLKTLIVSQSAMVRRFIDAYNGMVCTVPFLDEKPHGEKGLLRLWSILKEANCIILR